MLNMKKALVIGTALTAICASVAFAHEAKQGPAPENCGPRQHMGTHKMHRGGEHQKFMKPGPYVLMTEAEREAAKQRRETWKNMTPEQREAAYQKYINERIEKAPTPEAKAKLQKMEERRQAWKNMTPEQRKEAGEKMRAAREQQRQERLNKLTPQQKAEVEKFLKDSAAQRKAMQERLQKMTPEQKQCIRDARMSQGPHKMGPKGGFHGPRGDHRMPRPEQPTAK